MKYLVKSPLKILVIGDIMLDHYIHGACNRISPEAPVPVVEVKSEKYILGGAGNVLRNIKGLNCDAEIICVTGDDDDARIIETRLSELGTTKSYLIKDQRRCSTVKSRVLVANHQLIRLDREQPAPINDDVAEHIVSTLKQNIERYDIVLLSDYYKGLFTPVLFKNIFEICNQAKKITILDPKSNDFSRYKGVNIIKPNRKEAIAATGIEIKDEQSLKNVCAKIQAITECDSVVITMSEDGMACFENENLYVAPTKALDVIDVTGAGDTVLAALGVILGSGNSLQQACNFANHAAAVVVNKVGTAIASFSEIEESFLK